MGDRDEKHDLKPGRADVGHAVAKGLVSQIPALGGIAAEFIGLYVAAPASKRRDEWIKSLDDRVTALEDTVEGFQRDSLQENEMFVTAFLHAAPIAIRSHQEEKWDALRNAVLHAALRDPPDDALQLMFLHHIDVLTPWHLRVLEYLEDPRAWLVGAGVSFDGLRSGSRATLLEQAFAELKGRREFYEQIVRDLYARGLVSTDSLSGMVTAQGMMQPLTTETGKRFLDFISSPAARR